MLDPERRRFDREQRNRLRPPEGPDQANPPKERPKLPEGPEEAKAVPPIENIYKPSLEDIQREARRLETQRRTIAKLKAGDTVFRVVPSFGQDWRFYSESHVHYGVGPRRRCTQCLEDFGEPCLVCEKIAELSQSPDEDDRAEAKRMKKTARFLLNVIILDELEKGVQVISLTRPIVKMLVDYLADPEAGYFLDVDKGRNVKIRKTGEGLGTRYSDPQLSPKTSPIPYKDWRRDAKNLSDFFSRPSYESQRRLYEGIEDGEELS
jgi:hypothetical protein